MFRSALAAALRHLCRGKLYAAIAVFGLAVGLCAALLAALYIRSQYSFEHFVAGYQDLYQATTISPAEGVVARTIPSQTPQLLAALMKQRFPEIASVSRMTNQGATLRLGDQELGGHEGELRLSLRLIPTSSIRCRLLCWPVIRSQRWRGPTMW